VSVITPLSSLAHAQACQQSNAIKNTEVDEIIAGIKLNISLY
jgi:hypothetical protein